MSVRTLRSTASPGRPLLAIVLGLGSAAWVLMGPAERAWARPVPTIYPGGATEAPDTVRIDYAVRRSPSLLSLRAAGPLAAEAEPAAQPPDSTAFAKRLAGAVAPVAAPGAVPSLPGRPLSEPPGETIAFSGLKTISVEMGKNRAASLEQGLDLTVRGRVAGDVEVAATLSDRQLPFEPDGTSRELEDLDRVALSIRAPRGEATMGDFALEGMPGEFARLSRQLEGVRGAARTGDARWNVAAASAKGEKRTVEFRGEEGRQGPYPLLARSPGDLASGVVSGSEAVWLDGARLKRGSLDDYVIDYGAATVTFTVRRPITAQSRIAVDFEAGSGHYRRSLYAATTHGGVPRRGAWYASYVTEGDDADNPLGAELTPADREALGSMGDSITTTLPSGILYRGPGQGSYAWDESDPGSPRWVYLGASLGDFDVEFSSVGAGRGAYADTTGVDGNRYYRYRGENLGSFEPGRAVAAPSNRTLADVGGTARLFGAFDVEAEGARSGLDRNALSSRDDGDNEGLAGRLSMRLDARPIAWNGRGLGTIQARALVRSKGARFQPLDRIDPAFEGERWNQGAAVLGEDRQELALEYGPTAQVAIRGEAGHRALTGGSRSLRQAAQAELRSSVRGLLHWEEARNTADGSRGFRSVRGVELGRDAGWLLPRITATDERIEGQDGDSVDARSSRELVLGLGLVPTGAVRLRGGYGVREGVVRISTESPAESERATNWEGGISARAGALLTVEGGFTRRRVAYSNGATPRTTNLAQLAVLAGRPGAPVTSELRYDVTQLREATAVRELKAVGTGAGSYDAYGNPRLGGGYEMVTTTGVASTRSRAVAQWRLDAHPARSPVRPGGTAPLWRGLGGSTLVRLETLSSLPLGSLAHAFTPADYLAPETTLRGTLSARQTVELAPAGRGYDARAEIGFRRDQASEIENVASRRDAVDARVSLRHPLPGGLRGSAAVVYDRALQSVARGDSLGDYDARTDGRGLELEVSREIRGLGQLSLLSRARRDKDAAHGGAFDLWSMGPTARYTPGPRFRLDVRALYGWSAQRGTYAPPGLYVAAPVGSRVDYDILGDYRLRDRISLSFSWNGFRAAGRSGYYTGRLELKGSF